MNDSVFVHEGERLEELDEVKLASSLRVLRVHHPVEQLASRQILQDENHSGRLLERVVKLQKSRMLQLLHDVDLDQDVVDFAHLEVDVLAGQSLSR